MRAVLQDDRLILEGEINSTTVAGLLDGALAHVREGAETVDFSGVSDVDSAAVALALACIREAQARNHTLRFANLPPKFNDLARLYNVSELFLDAAAV
ncbi:MAG TPA: STAS domain-containing protein [Burkholderiales bacterium]|nr:STAS domain-containing protein [Burkholderiales bacterium]